MPLAAKFLLGFDFFSVIASCIGLAGGATAIGLGVGGILAAGLSIGCGATVSGLSAFTKINQNKHDKVVIQLSIRYKELETEISEIMHDYVAMTNICRNIPEKTKEIEIAKNSGPYYYEQKQ